MGWFTKLKGGLDKSSQKLDTGIVSAITGKAKLSDEALEELEEVLIASDMGLDASLEVIQSIRKTKLDKQIDNIGIKQALADEISTILKPVAKKLSIADYSTNDPIIVMMIGVNGNGKTTSTGKLASQFVQAGNKAMLVACDTFRAAAVEQLKVWSDRSGASFYTKEIGQDPASVCYEALKSAKDENYDIVFVDTAGRLQNKSGLMEELAKINKTAAKVITDAPHETILVIDATTGQNALSQVEEFSKITNITGIIITKIDGSAKGGIVVALAKKYGIPIYAIGVGEGIEDMQPFEAQDFANNLVGLGE